MSEAVEVKTKCTICNRKFTWTYAIRPNIRLHTECVYCEAGVPPENLTPEQLEYYDDYDGNGDKK